MSQNPDVHDAQGDAMPCSCPACISPFVPRGKRHVAVTAIARQERVIGVVEAAAGVTRCAIWCGDACSCGRGPESDDLDPLDVAGMRAVEGRAS